MIPSCPEGKELEVSWGPPTRPLQVALSGKVSAVLLPELSKAPPVAWLSNFLFPLGGGIGGRGLVRVGAEATETPPTLHAGEEEEGSDVGEGVAPPGTSPLRLAIAAVSSPLLPSEATGLVLSVHEGPKSAGRLVIMTPSLSSSWSLPSPLATEPDSFLLRVGPRGKGTGFFFLPWAGLSVALRALATAEEEGEGEK